MPVESKLKNPICIRIGNRENILIEKDGHSIPLVPGIMFGGEHYGFVLIVDFHGKQREVIYPTQCSIQAVGLKDEKLCIFEDGKKEEWMFDKTGRVEASATDKFTDEYLSKTDIAAQNEDIFFDKPLLLNPVLIRISSSPEKSLILGRDADSIDYPLFPGAMLGDLHYGFILMYDADNGDKEVAYPTQNRVDAVGIEGGYFGDLKVFEEGKYHPWVFTYDGKFKNQSSYEAFSRRDKKYLSKEYDFNKRGPFKLKKKNDE